MAQGQKPQVVGDAAKLRLPVPVLGKDRQFVQDQLADPVQQRRTVGRVPVQAHRIPPQLLPEPPHRERIKALGVNKLQGGGQHQLPAQPCLAPGGRGVWGGLVGGHWFHPGREKK